MAQMVKEWLGGCMKKNHYHTRIGTSESRP